MKSTRIRLLTQCYELGTDVMSVVIIIGIARYYELHGAPN